MHNSTWKNLEYDTAEELGGKRISRLNYATIAPDVYIEDFQNLKIDCKRYKKFAVYPLFEEIKTKYCKGSKDEAVLVLRQWSKHPLVVVDMKFFRKLLDFVRAKGGQNEF